MHEHWNQTQNMLIIPAGVKTYSSPETERLSETLDITGGEVMTL